MGMLPCKVQQRVHLDRSFVPAKLRPRKQPEAEVDGGRIQRVQTLIQIDADRIVGIQRSCDANQHLSEVRVDAPIVRLVGIGQCRARHVAAQSDVVELAGHGTQTGLDIAETLAVRQLSESHRQKLVPARKASQVIVAMVAGDTLAKLVRGHVIHKLSENGATDVHATFCRLPPVFTSKAIFRPRGFQIEKCSDTRTLLLPLALSVVGKF